MELSDHLAKIQRRSVYQNLAGQWIEAGERDRLRGFIGRGWPSRPAQAGGWVPASRDKIRSSSLCMNWGFLQKDSCDEI
jgi:hypothetical protein